MNWQVGKLPSSRGGVPERINSSLESEGGVVAQGGNVSTCVFSTWCVSDHPVCAAKVASRHFVNGAATPPLEEGSSLTCRFIHTLLDRPLQWERGAERRDIKGMP